MNRLGNNPPAAFQSGLPAPKPRLRSTFFRRVQIGLAILGIMNIGGSYLHANLSPNTAWGLGPMLILWIGLTIAALGAMYLLHPAFLRSGMLLVWVAVLAVAFIGTWVIAFPLNLSGNPRFFVVALWAACFAVGYFTVGYFLDRRFWWLAGWELLVALVMFVFGTNLIAAPAFIATNRPLFYGYTTGIPLLIAALPIWKEHLGV